MFLRKIVVKWKCQLLVCDIRIYTIRVSEWNESTQLFWFRGVTLLVVWISVDYATNLYGSWEYYGMHM